MSQAPQAFIQPRPTVLRRYGIWIVSAAALAVLPHIFGSTLGVTILNQMGIVIVFALSYNMLLGQGGMLSFGHAVYFGLGGFIAVHFMNFIADGTVPLPIPFVPLFGGLAGLVFGIIFGSFSTNRAGTVFAMISLGIGELIASSSLIFVGFFGGEEGVTGDRTEAPPFFGFDFAHDVEVYYVIAAWTFLAVVLMYLFSQTPAGRMANAVRDNPERAEFVGYSQKTVRFISFSAAGFFAGIAGGLFAINYEIITEETLNLTSSGTVLLMAYIGGIGFFGGPIIGAVVFTLLQTLLSNYTEIWALYVGIVFLATVMYAPAGLTGLLMMHGPVLRSGKLGSLVIPYLKVVIPAIICGLGVVGLLEMLNFANASSVGETDLVLFGFNVDAFSATPWAVALVATVGGFLLARRAAPHLVAAWEEATTHPVSGPASARTGP